MIFSTLEHILTHISFSTVSVVITLHLITLIVNEKVRLYNSLKKGMIVTFFSITGVLIARWFYWNHFPLSDLYESVIFLSWSFYIIHMIPYFKTQKNNLSAITTPSAIFTQGFATSGFLKEMHQSSILVPALQSQWLMMHVSMMVLGYAALLGGSLLSIALLIITFQKDIIRIFNKRKLVLNESFLFSEIQYIKEKSTILQSASPLFVRNYYRSQLIEQLDHWSYRVISLGFILLTLGILSGAVWANEAWGSYWNWDPKETWAFITWTIFAIYLHIRTNKNLQGTNSAIVAFFGFLIIWICYFGVNLLGIGLHSYGSFMLN
uniref:Cytochrome c biogenesis protein CcsA n=1 Tax=Gymnocarpos przewalskii TaxID=157677 RepID=A0A2I6C1N6_9CARY|nr:cytochrome c heme attachment protein [Gymnocarpos przewalskii]AUJ23103.1 cytochrome c heme attachment protein [Gymnocarpos przewalskii]UVW79807.1 cytochrome c heme attachment protein [Gymnocarpos przewalskii]UVW79888.1 cytochrome c heme attachment protein [Gymnocarpos przewalskii]UVW79969.1 cytochrome c heme attachment protein [Gymnocarpos przewalskii]